MPHHAAGIGCATLTHGLVAHHTPERGDMLLQFPVHHERPVAAQVAAAIGTVIRVLEQRQDSLRIERTRHERCWRNHVAVIPVAQDELTGWRAAAGQPDDGRGPPRSSVEHAARWA
jgi:hypothetical protein